MESSYLKTFVEVVKAGTFSRAAENLNLTQPGVSRRIKMLEEQYGCELIDRSGRALRPTPAGKLVFEAAQTLLGVEQNLMSGLRVLGGKSKIAFSCTPSFGIAHLPSVLKDFMLACPDSADLKFVFNSPEQILQGITARSFDLAVMELCEAFDLSPLASFPLPGDEVVFASAPALDLPPHDTPIEALLDVPFFVRREGCCSRMLLESNLHAVGHDLREFRQVIVHDDLHLIIQAILDGEGISFLSRDVLRDHLAAGRLVAHKIPGFHHSRQRALVLERPVALDEASSHFVTALFNHFDVLIPDELFANRDWLEPAVAAAPSARTTRNNFPVR
ncbi:MAG: LysR family transcriptional regulator [Acidobacteria bacterium]|nr:LysR family transcriptional regulator [Acidobacteriota bacterium]